MNVFRIVRILSVSIMSVLVAVSSVIAAPQKSAPHPPLEARDEQPPATLSGKVAETMNAGGYTYILLESGGKKQWVALPEMKVKVGQQVSLKPGYVMPNFTSKALDRTFDEIIFSGGLADSSPAGVLPPGHADMPGGGPGSKGAASPKEKGVKVLKAEGAGSHTIAEIFAKRSSLHKKAVTVKAKVVKVSTGIMGMNWVHLQDGTGDQKKNTHNLVVTTDERPSVGDVITMKGIITKDKDFGAGYKYDVIMENGELQN